MIYVALRLLGTDKDLPEMIEIRALIHKMGQSRRRPIVLGISRRVANGDPREQEERSGFLLGPRLGCRF